MFSQKGYDGARVEEIAQCADLSKGNILYYFKTKKNLYRVVIEQVLSLSLEALGDISADDDPCDAISQYIRRKLDLSRDYSEASSLFAIEVIGDARDWGAS